MRWRLFVSAPDNIFLIAAINTMLQPSLCSLPLLSLSPSFSLDLIKSSLRNHAPSGPPQRALSQLFASIFCWFHCLTNLCLRRCPPINACASSAAAAVASVAGGCECAEPFVTGVGYTHTHTHSMHTHVSCYKATHTCLQRDTVNMFVNAILKLTSFSDKLWI